MAGVLRRPALLLCLLIVAAQSVLLVGLMRDPGFGEPHEVPLAIVAPGVVAQSLAERANKLPQTPFAASPIPSADHAEALARARSSVGSGSTVAAVVVDLRGTRDTLVVDPERDARLNESILARVRSVAASYERTVGVEYTDRAGARGRPSTVMPQGPADAYDFTLGASIVGFLIVLAISLLRGPVAPTPRQSLRRLAVVAGLSLLAGPALLVLPPTSLPGPAPELVALGALSVGAAAVGTLALEALAGLTGLTLAAAMFFVLATPLVTRTDVYLLPDGWALVAPGPAPEPPSMRSTRSRSPPRSPWWSRFWSWSAGSSWRRPCSWSQNERAPSWASNGPLTGPAGLLRSCRGRPAAPSEDPHRAGTGRGDCRFSVPCSHWRWSSQSRSPWCPGARRQPRCSRARRRRRAA